MATVELRTLGECLIVAGTNRITPSSPHLFALALYLSMERGRSVTRDEVVALFFPDGDKTKRAHRLRQHEYRLREEGIPCSTTAAGTIVIDADVRDDFSALLATGELPEPRNGRMPGEFLRGYWPKISDEFARWVETQRELINGALRRAYVARIEDRRQVARWDQVEQLARACLLIDPLNKRATFALAEVLALGGSQVSAIKLLDDYTSDVGDSPELATETGMLRKRLCERFPTSVAPYSDPAFIGREAELKRMAQARAEAHAGFASSMFIWGEPGIGKTRLVREFTRGLALTSVRFVAVTLQPHDLRRAMSLLVDLVPQLLRLPGALGAAPESVQLLRRLTTTGDEEPHAVGLTTADSPEELLSIISDALSDLLDAVATDCSLIVTVDDFHWADGPSRRIIQDIMAERKQRRLLLLVTSRHPIGNIPLPEGSATVHLRSLSTDEGIQFALTALKDDIRTASLAERVMQSGGGNPYYLKSLCDHVNHKGELEDIPPRQQELLSNRLASLSDNSRTVLTMIAVLGRACNTARLSAALSMPCYEMANSLAELEREGHIVLKDSHVDIHHSTLAKAVLESEMPTRGALLRRAAASLLTAEAKGSGDIALLWDAADHWIAAGDPHNAKDALEVICIHAANVGAYSQALEALGRFARVTNHRDAETLSRVLRNRVLSTCAYPVQMLTEWDSRREVLSGRDAEQDLDLTMLDVSRYYRGDAEVHRDFLLSLIQDARNSHRLRIKAGSIGMCIADDTNDRALATIIADELIQEDGLIRGRLDMYSVRLLLAYHCRFGDPAVALSVAREIASWPDNVAAEDNTSCLVNASFALFVVGRTDEAIAVVERAVALAPRRSGYFTSAYCHRQWFARHLGDTADIRFWSDQLRSMANGDLMTLDSMGVYGLAHAAILDGDVPTAKLLLTELRARITTVSHSSHWAELTAIEIQIGLLEGGSIPPAEVIDRVKAWAVSSAGVCPDDEVAFATYQGLTHRGDDADEFLRDYLGNRRHDTTLSAALRKLITERSAPSADQRERSIISA